MIPLKNGFFYFSLKIKTKISHILKEKKTPYYVDEYFQNLGKLWSIQHRKNGNFGRSPTKIINDNLNKFYWGREARGEGGCKSSFLKLEDSDPFSFLLNCYLQRKKMYNSHRHNPQYTPANLIFTHEFTFHNFIRFCPYYSHSFNYFP